MNATNENHDALIKRIGVELQTGYWDTHTIKVMQDCRAALSQRVRYVPMSEAERNEMMARWYENHELPSISQYIEAEVIRRAGLEVTP